MCVACLNVTTQPCNHRWYKLVRSCHPANNLANCPERLRLQGWETRNETCPWCDEDAQTVHDSTHRLFGSVSSASSIISSPTSPEMCATRTHRSGSGGTLSSLSRHSSTSSTTESDRAQRQRERNDRLHLYLTTHPHEVLPSAKKNYPNWTERPVEDSTASDSVSVRSTAGLVSKAWKKRVRFSKTMMNG